MESLKLADQLVKENKLSDAVPIIKSVCQAMRSSVDENFWKQAWSVAGTLRLKHAVACINLAYPRDEDQKEASTSTNRDIQKSIRDDFSNIENLLHLPGTITNLDSYCLDIIDCYNKAGDIKSKGEAYFFLGKLRSQRDNYEGARDAFLASVEINRDINVERAIEAMCRLVFISAILGNKMWENSETIKQAEVNKLNYIQVADPAVYKTAIEAIKLQYELAFKFYNEIKEIAESDANPMLDKFYAFAQISRGKFLLCQTHEEMGYHEMVEGLTQFEKLADEGNKAYLVRRFTDVATFHESMCTHVQGNAFTAMEHPRLADHFWEKATLHATPNQRLEILSERVKWWKEKRSYIDAVSTMLLQVSDFSENLKELRDLLSSVLLEWLKKGKRTKNLSELSEIYKDVIAGGDLVTIGNKWNSTCLALEEEEKED